MSCNNETCKCSPGDCDCNFGREVEYVVNEHGHWLSVEDIIHNYMEFQLKPDGIYMEDKLLITWEKTDEIRSKL